MSSVELNNRGDFFSLKADPSTDHDPALAAFVWMDRERRYFISSAGSLSNGKPYTRLRWRQVDDQPNAAPPQKVNLVIGQPQIAEMYYSTCSAIDKHNRYRQDDLRMEKKLETHNWSMRVNLSIFAMTVVDTWLVFNGFRKDSMMQNVQHYTQKEFYSVLAEELIDNKYDARGGGKRSSSSAKTSFEREACLRAIESTSPRSGVLTHLTPVKRLKNSRGEKTSFRYQGRCKECQKKTTWQCSDCDDNGNTVYLCSTKNGKRCFVEHLSRNHAYRDEHSL